MLAERILNGVAQPGVHRALVDLKTWTLLKWLDDPCPFYDWRGSEERGPPVHPDDELEMTSMATEFGAESTSRVLRLRARGGGWTPIHITAHRVELEEDTFAGLLSLRLPTDDEIAFADERPQSRAARKSSASKHKGKDKAARTQVAPRIVDNSSSLDLRIFAYTKMLAG
ncbi:MAG: hypothetical protein QOI25_3567 [Mycobacterium sp.]|nr:hypothetical protein [Mycobacterium sp.]